LKKIYLAGPDVFEQNAIEIGKRYVDLCSKYGFLGLYPLDNEIEFSDNKHQVAKDIFIANVKLIDKADIVVANLNSFRGKEPDSGTVWECGYAYAKGKKVYGYMKSTKAYIEKFTNLEKYTKDDLTIDTQGMIIEDFDYPANLMISCSTKIFDGELEDVLKVIEKN
jgi:nucleoside 2-deoxyribosyltransferase